MIYVTQGHEKSISIEIFLKAFSCLTKNEKSQISYICNKNNLKNYATPNGLNIIDIHDNELESTSCLKKALEIVKKSDILVTMPTSKDQLAINNIQANGHTEFFRSYFKDEYINMYFWSNKLKVLLLTDHININQITDTLTPNYVVNKLVSFLESHNKVFKSLPKKIIFAGINPHCGENGLIGIEDESIEDSIPFLKEDYPNIEFVGPKSADTLHSNQDDDTVFVYAYHDQGLPVFKSQTGFNGLNITLGLPFLRISPDHGTAFEIFDKDCANYMGALETLKFALNHSK